jgi:type IV pilus assembly protein PilA
MKKGFTLVELLAVIIIISIISLIVFPVVTKQITQSKENLYDVQVQTIIKAAKEKALDEEEILEKAKYGTVYITIEELQETTDKDGKTYLEAEPIKNPIDDSVMDGEVKITYDESSKSYAYEYLETKESTTTLTLAADYIISKQDKIYTNETDVSGLFEDSDTNTYYFKGANPNNYIKIDNETWVITSINKKTKEIKVAKSSHNVKVVWSNSTLTDYQLTNTNLNIYNYLNNNISDFMKERLNTEAIWNVGAVSFSNQTLKQVIVEEQASTITSAVGLLSVSDYMFATTNLSCRKNDKDSTCKDSNYLVDDKTYFLLNSVKGEENVWTITPSGLAKVSGISEQNVIPTAILKASSTISEGTGTSTDPYVLQ